VLTLIFGLAVIISGPEPKEAKNPSSPILGEWALEDVIFMGKVMPSPKRPTTMIFKADGTSVSAEVGGANPQKSTYKLDTKKTPAQIDITYSAGKKVAGIYKIEGKSLTICISDGDRPAKFASDDKVMMLSYKRVEK